MRRSRSRSLLTVAALLAALTSPVAAAQAHTAQSVPAAPRTTAADGAAALTLTGTSQLDPRLAELTFTTPAFTVPTKARVLLPPDYATTTRSYPVLYMLHGTNEDQTNFTTKPYGIEGDDLPVIIVMPYGGVGGEYADWDNSGTGGPPEYETYDVRELVPWIDAHYRTLARRSERAITGDSMGGLGTMEFAARNPDVFGIAGSMSGAVALVSAIGRAGVTTNETLGVATPGTIFGNPLTDEINFRGHSPTDLALNLGNTLVSAYAHNGMSLGCDPVDDANDQADAAAGAGLEAVVAEMAQEFDASMTGVGVAHSYANLGPGSHTTPCFKEELDDYIVPMMMKAFAADAPDPTTVSYTSTAASWTQWGWSVALSRPVTEFSTLTGASRTGFGLYGSGSGTVTTPPVYAPGRAYAVTVTPSAAGQQGAGRAEGLCVPPAGTGPCLMAAVPPPTATAAPLTPGSAHVLTLVGDAAGRLVVPLDLGPANTVQEYATPGNNSPTTIYRTQVAIAAAPTTTTTTPRKPLPPKAPPVKVPRKPGASAARGATPARAVRVTQPTQTLAFTGLPAPYLPMGILGLAFVGLRARGRRRR